MSRAGSGKAAISSFTCPASAARPIPRAHWLWIFACVCLSAGSVIAQQQNTDAAESFVPPRTPVTAGGSYVISADDELDIQVIDVPEVSGKYRVGADGSLTLPLLSSPLTAQNLSLQQLGNQISKALQEAGMISHPNVSVRILSSRVHSISVGGAVKKPLVYQTFSGITLLDALSLAEGLADDAGTTAVIIRAGQPRTVASSVESGAVREGSPGAETVNLKRLLEEGQASANVELYPGDRVTVQRAGIVYVVGGVNKAGGFPLSGDRNQLTVLEAVALAGDLKSTALGKKAVVIRSGQEVPVDVNRILSGHAPDQKLMASDILFIPDSSTKKALHRAGEAAAEAAALVAGYRFP